MVSKETQFSKQGLKKKGGCRETESKTLDTCLCDQNTNNF